MGGGSPVTSGTGAGDAREAVRPVTRFAGYCAVVSGLLYAGRAMLERAIGEPPTAGGDLVAWRDAHQAGLAWADELMVLSAALLPAVRLVASGAVLGAVNGVLGHLG